MIELDNASVTFKAVQDVEALKDMTLSIEKGSWVNILGPSGSGKTTLLNAIGGMARLSSGTITVEEREISELSNDELQTYRRETIGYVFQDYRLFNQYTVLENVMLPQWPYEERKSLESRAKAVLTQLQMDHRLHALPEELSGGEKQRTAIARALLHKPKILLCDEPTGNLDEENREIILGILQNLHENGMTIVLVTHDLTVAEWGTDKLYIRDGMLQEEVGV